jgi:hypothetical protein
MSEEVSKVSVDLKVDETKHFATILHPLRIFLREPRVSKLLGTTSNKPIRINCTSTVCKAGSAFESMMEKYSTDILKLSGNDRQALNTRISGLINNKNETNSICKCCTPKQRDELKLSMLKSMSKIVVEIGDGAKKIKSLLELLNEFEYGAFESKNEIFRFEGNTKCILKFKKR